MALKEDAHAIASELRDLADRAERIAYLIPSPAEVDALAKAKLPWSRQELHRLIADPLMGWLEAESSAPSAAADDVLAALMSAASFRGVIVPDEEHLTETGRKLTGTDFERLADEAERLTLMPPGVKIGRRDRNGKKLRSGDIVQVFDSERYGNPTGVVRGPGPDHGDGKERVLIRLDMSLDGAYTPSTGRVERLRKAERAPATGHGNGEIPDDAPPMVVFAHIIRQSDA